jgi:hypothetical protein
VQHPEFVARCASGRTIAVSDSEGAFEIVDLLLVSSLEEWQKTDIRLRCRPQRSFLELRPHHLIEIGNDFGAIDTQNLAPVDDGFSGDDHL